MKEKVRQEVLKLLEAGMIYHISDNSWVSLVQVVPKKDDMIVVKNDKNEIIPTTTVRGWRICVNYRRFNNAIRKDKFPFPFTDKMLERVFDRAFYSFLDGYSGYNQIAVNTLVATYPSAGGRRETHGSIFQGRKTRGVATNVYLSKTSEKPEKRWSTNFK